jgi:hypothetical protein
MKRRLAGFLLVLALGPGLAACGDGDGGDDSAATTEPGNPTSTTEDEVTPTTDGTGSSSATDGLDMDTVVDALRDAGFTDGEIDCLAEEFAGIDVADPTDLAGSELGTALSVLETCGIELQRLGELDLSALTALAGLGGVLPGSTATTERDGSATTDGSAAGPTDPTDPEAVLSDALSTLSGLGFTQEEIDCLAGELAAMGAQDSAALEELDPAAAFGAFDSCGIGLERLAALSG